MEIATSHAMKFKWPYNRDIITVDRTAQKIDFYGIPTICPSGLNT